MGEAEALNERWFTWVTGPTVSPDEFEMMRAAVGGEAQLLLMQAWDARKRGSEDIAQRFEKLSREREALSRKLYAVRLDQAAQGLRIHPRAEYEL